MLFFPVLLSIVRGNFKTTLSLNLPNESESESQSCLTLRPHRLYSPWNSPGQNTGVGSYTLLQGIFPAQGSNPGLPHCRQTTG